MSKSGKARVLTPIAAAHQLSLHATRFSGFLGLRRSFGERIKFSHSIKKMANLRLKSRERSTAKSTRSRKLRIEIKYHTHSTKLWMNCTQRVGEFLWLHIVGRNGRKTSVHKKFSHPFIVIVTVMLCFSNCLLVSSSSSSCLF